MIDLFSFFGTRPQLDPKKLGDRVSQIAHNVWIASGSFDPLRDGELLPNPDGHDWSATNTLYRFKDVLLGPAEQSVQFVKSPIIGDTYERIYFVDNELLQFYRYSDLGNNPQKPTNLLFGHRLGVEAPLPSGDTVITPEGGADYLRGALLNYLSEASRPPVGADNVEDVAVIYTYVNRWGEESPPSFPSNVQRLVKPGKMAIDGLVINTTDPNIVGKRVYMTDKNGVYYRLTEPSVTIDGIPNITVPNSESTINEFTASDANLAGVLVTQEWDRPPAGIKHFIELGNGMTVAATDNELLFNVPYYIHAWPTTHPYRRRINEKILRLEPIDGGFVVLTDGSPTVLVGTHPENMYELDSTFHHRITDPRSATRVDNGVAYSTDEGIAFISARRAEILTDGAADKRPWQAMVDINTVRMSTYEGRMIFMTRNPFNANAPIGYIYNVARNDFTTFDIDEESIGLGFYRDPLTNDLIYRLGTQLYTFNAAAGKRTGQYRTGKYMLPHALNMAYCRVEADTYPVTLNFDADGRKFSKVVKSNKPTAIKATGRKNWLSVEVMHNDRVTSVQVGPDLASIA